ncbi:cupredoxin domain-containing protein [Nonomuraea dietziae]|uniref:cupredoxin domain-containing protein n=1 Tax=Nonomuraea dietziae TaxID=65515 RepID=UPI003CD05B5C
MLPPPSRAPRGAPRRAAPIKVAASDTACTVATSEVAAGTSTFAVTNGGTKVTEFYVYAPGDRVMAEVENIVPGLTRELIVELPAGVYETACKPGMVGKGHQRAAEGHGRGHAAQRRRQAGRRHRQLPALRQEPDRRPADQDAGVRRRGEGRRAGEGQGALPRRAHLLGADRACRGDLRRPRPQDRRPVRRSSRRGMEFTGFHRLERDLWVDKDVSKSGPIADRLMADVKLIVEKANSEKLSPLQLGNGAKELLDEVATGKITGEEDRYSPHRPVGLRRQPGRLEGVRAGAAPRAGGARPRPGEDARHAVRRRGGRAGGASQG